MWYTAGIDGCTIISDAEGLLDDEARALRWPKLRPDDKPLEPVEDELEEVEPDELFDLGEVELETKLVATVDDGLLLFALPCDEDEDSLLELELDDGCE